MHLGCVIVALVRDYSNIMLFIRPGCFKFNNSNKNRKALEKFCTERERERARKRKRERERERERENERMREREMNNT